MVRGEVWWVDFGLPRGSAPALRRPAVIVSADQFNRSHLATVAVAVVTTTTRLAALPGNVALPVDAGVLGEDSVINVTQVATVDRDALEEQIGTLPAWLMAKVDDGLRLALGLSA